MFTDYTCHVIQFSPIYSNKYNKIKVIMIFLNNGLYILKAFKDLKNSTDHLNSGFF